MGKGFSHHLARGDRAEHSGDWSSASDAYGIAFQAAANASHRVLVLDRDQQLTSLERLTTPFVLNTQGG